MTALVAALSLAWLIGPGLAVGRAAGLRGLGLVALAPALTFAALGLGGLVAPAVGLRWSVGTALAATALAAGIGFAFGRVFRLDAPRALPRWTARQWGEVGVAVGLAIGGGYGAALAGMGSVGAILQRHDSVFHGNLVRFVLDTGNASPLHAGLLNHPGAEASYYPTALHALVALLPVGGSVWPAFNLTVLAGTTVPWTVGLVYLSRVLFPSRPGFAVVAAVAAVVYQSAPAGLIGLVPNAVALALLPGILAWSVQLARVVSVRSPGRIHRVGMLAVVLGGASLVHPSALISYLVVALPVAGYIALTLAARGWRSGHRVLVGGVAGIAVSAIAVSAWAVLGLREVQAVVNYAGWERSYHPLVGMAGGLTDMTSPFQFAPNLVALFGVAAGIAVTLRARRHRWLVASFALAVVLYVAAASNLAAFRAVTALWYADRARLGVLITVISIPLATIGLDWARQVVVADRGRRSRWIRAGVAAVGAVALVGAIVVAAMRPARLAAQGYVLRSDPQWPRFFDADELALIERLPSELEPGWRILGDPANGSAFAYSVAGIEVVFAHLTGVWDADRRYVREHLADLGADPELCQALGRLRVRYMYLDPVSYRDQREYVDMTAGLDVPGTTVPIDSGGGAEVREIVACGND
ncbi:MAG: hypothetical protein LBJ08_12500 [Bifidobacteriaceae bacterium]|jgi:hypothetical protein|nr:hypothetical protein [Bifidobacteriaceae bacterium]